MADPESAVTDTHPLIFHAAGGGRLGLRRSTRTFFEDLFSNPAYQPLDLTPEHVFLADELCFTRDPFDALIVSAAQTAGLPLVTRDNAIRESGTVGVIW